jgi:hypothetical protein
LELPRQKIKRRKDNMDKKFYRLTREIENPTHDGRRNYGIEKYDTFPKGKIIELVDMQKMWDLKTPRFKYKIVMPNRENHDIHYFDLDTFEGVICETTPTPAEEFIYEFDIYYARGLFFKALECGILSMDAVRKLDAIIEEEERIKHEKRMAKMHESIASQNEVQK